MEDVCGSVKIWKMVVEGLALPQNMIDVDDRLCGSLFLLVY